MTKLKLSLVLLLSYYFVIGQQINRNQFIDLLSIALNDPVMEIAYQHQIYASNNLVLIINCDGYNPLNESQKWLCNLQDDDFSTLKGNVTIFREYQMRNSDNDEVNLYATKLNTSFVDGRYRLFFRTALNMDRRQIHQVTFYLTEEDGQWNIIDSSVVFQPNSY
jgi:hypothetical protein